MSFTFIFRLFKLVGTLMGLLMSSLSTFKAIKGFLAAKSDESMPVA